MNSIKASPPSTTMLMITASSGDPVLYGALPEPFRQLRLVDGL